MSVSCMPQRPALVLRLGLLAAFFALASLVPVHAETFRNPRRLPLPVDPQGVTTGDLNGDGRNDIVWIEQPPYPGTALLHVLLAGGNGQYTSAPDLTLPFAPTFIDCIIQDVTGDKRKDLICVAPSTNYTDVFLFTYPGKGDGTFAAPVLTKVTAQPTFSNPILAPAGDLNGDGLSDVVLLNAYNSGILPYLSDGQGGFKVAAPFVGSFNYSVPTITDLDGDGKLDILWPTGPRVNLGHGDGTFSAPAQYDPGFLSSCAFGDVDHDGHLDAVCTWFGNGLDGHINLTVLHGNSDGSFSKTPLFTRTFGNGENQYDGIPTILAPVLVADLNGDGLLDIVSLSGDGYCVLLGGPNATWNGQPQQFVAASFQSEGGLLGIYGVSIADMNGDGLPDIVAIGPNGLYITYAQRDGTLSSAPAPEVGQVSTSATLVDVNGDGNLDVISAGDTALKLSLGRGDGTFNPPQPITTTGNFGFTNGVVPHVSSGDFNGDGKQDLLASGGVSAYTSQNYILFGHGDGTFDPPKPTAVSLGEVADLNNDGRSDVISTQNNFPNSVLVAGLSRGDGSFTPLSTNLPVDFVSNGSHASFSRPSLADFRHSGLRDVAIASFNNAYLLRGHGDGTFDSTATPLPIPDLPNLNKIQVSDVSTGDFDGDGNPDIAVLLQYGNGPYNFSTPTSAVWVFYGKGDGTFSPAALAGTFNRHAETLNAGDLNGDRLDDLVLTSYNGYEYTGVLVVHALPNRAWSPETDYTGGEGLSRLWITDINHDGRKDLIFSNARRLNEASNSISVLLNEPADGVTGTLTATPEPSNVTYPFTLHCTLVPSNPGSNLSGTVTFSVDGTAVGTAALTSNTASFSLSGTGLAAGSHTLSASWPGDSIYPPVTLNGTHAITLLPLNISLAVTPSSINVGGTITASTTLTPGILPNQTGYQFPGSLTLYDNGTAIARQQVPGNTFSFTLPPMAIGTHTLSVSYPGDALFSAVQSNPQIVVVVGAASIATLTVAPVSSTYGTPVTLTATIAAASPSLSSVPAGSVIFTVDGKPLPPVLLTNAAASTVLTNLGTSTHTVSCTYSGDTTYAPSACNLIPIVVTAAPSAFTVTSSRNPSIAYTPVTFTIHLTLDGRPAPLGTQFTFSLMGNSGNSVLQTDSNGTATDTTGQLFARTWDAVAIFSGSNNYTNALTHFAQIVTAAPTTLSLTAQPNPAYLGQTVTLTASTSPSGTTFPTGIVTFLEGATTLGTGTLNGNGQASLSTSTLAVGTHTIVAAYSGDGGFLTATSTPIVVVISFADVVLTTDHSSLTLQTEHHGSLNVALTSIGGLGGTFTLACGPLPAWATCHFSSPTLALPASGTAATSLEFDTDAVLHFKSTLQLPGTPGRPSSKMPLLALAPLAWCALGLRRKNASLLQGSLLRLAVPFILLALTLLSGCGDKYPGHTEPGSYTVQITATSIPGSTPIPMNRSAAFSLLVTP